jgi:DNA-3-methyladenine glycosylase II
MAFDLLDDRKLLDVVKILADRDPDLELVVKRYGPPPLWSRPQGFASLIQIILEQQVSLSSAKAAYNRLQVVTSELTPRSFLELDDQELKAIGFSRQKTRYGQLLAKNLLDGSLDLASLENLNDEVARSKLIQLKGIGPWSADIYLLMALRRPDIWPRNDLALVSAITRIKRLEAPPSPEEFEAIGEIWRPWRSVAARIAWFDYLGGKP